MGRGCAQPEPDSGVADSLGTVWCPAVQSELGVGNYVGAAVTCQRVCSLIASRDELPSRVPAIDVRGVASGRYHKGLVVFYNHHKLHPEILHPCGGSDSDFINLAGRNLRRLQAFVCLRRTLHPPEF